MTSPQLALKYTWRLNYQKSSGNKTKIGSCLTVMGKKAGPVQRASPGRRCRAINFPFSPDREEDHSDFGIP
jgi:hypothetical protein